jgi:hypothetical protein
MKRSALWIAAAIASTSFLAVGAHAHGRHGGTVWISPSVHVGGGHGHWRGGRVGVGIGFGVPVYAYPHVVYGSPVLVAPAPIAYTEPWQAPVPMAAPDPLFVPRQGQSTARVEADRQECNRWAIGQPGAMPDARVFHNATLACMESKGYAIR